MPVVVLSARRLGRRLGGIALGIWAVLLALLGLRQLPQALQYGGITDWLAFAGGGRLVVADPAHLYSVTAQASTRAELLGPSLNHALTLGPGAFPYANPPLLALAISPLASLPLTTGALLWTGLLLACLVASVVVAMGLLPSGWSRWQRAALALILLEPLTVVASLGWGQLVVLAILALLLAVRRLRNHGDSLLGGLLLGLVAIKPQYGWLLPLALLVTGLWRSLAGLLGAALVWAGSSVALVGARGSVAWVTEFIPARFADQVQSGAGLPSLFQALVPGVPGFATTLLCAAAAAALLWVCRARLRAHPELAAAVGVSLSILCSPHAFAWDMAVSGVLLVLLVPSAGTGLCLCLAFLLDGVSLRVYQPGSQWAALVSLEAVLVVGLALAGTEAAGKAGWLTGRWRRASDAPSTQSEKSAPQVARTLQQPASLRTRLDPRPERPLLCSQHRGSREASRNQAELDAQ